MLGKNSIIEQEVIDRYKNGESGRAIARSLAIRDIVIYNLLKKAKIKLRTPAESFKIAYKRGLIRSWAKENKGKIKLPKRTKEHMIKIANKLRGRKLSKESIIKRQKTRMNKGGYVFSQNTREKLRKNNAKYWLGKTRPEETNNKIRWSIRAAYERGCYIIFPNNFEKQILKLINSNGFPFKYVGDGKFWVETFNPDFVDKKNKKIIETFGDYWHNLPHKKERDKLRIKTYIKNGFKVLVIWERELKDMGQVSLKIKEFINGGGTKC